MSQKELNEMLYGQAPKPAQDAPEIPHETAAELENRLQSLDREHNAIAARLEAELKNMKDQRFPASMIEGKQREIDTENRLHLNFYGRAKERLEIRSAYEKQQAQALHDDQVRESEAAKARYKDDARRQWLANGGNPDTFEAKFPDLWEAELMRRMASGNTPSQQHADQVRRMF